ncbi:hypothetical protein CASFOL_012749 [Castilleja foliolosa]|uniref:Leucine-rich repeat-containing N-terminal plant-type domain-containing protein n=1 Tax=Castilleja foliolosa TaxID=1961234 RepID=A0ABD3DLR7_9LAMI
MTKLTLSSSQTGILVFLFFVLLFLGDTKKTIPNTERTILFGFKKYWLNPSSLDDWNQSTDHCKWSGITCTNGRVTKLIIPDGNITGTLPPTICDLKNLVHIDLQWNYIPGPFPTVLYKCSKLEHLDLSQNYFIGTIPHDINRLSSNLQYLSLTGNNYTGDIPASIGSFPKLKSLQLVQNLFNGSFPPEIGNF